jgi:uncharacterized OsmC-like protein
MGGRGMTDATKITAKLTGNGIQCENVEGKTVLTGGEGPKPTELLLMSAAACSTLTFKAILDRDGLDPTEINVAVEGMRGTTPPRQFTDIYLHYRVQCPGLTEARLQRYLKISESACPVIKSLSAKTHVTYELIER